MRIIPFLFGLFLPLLVGCSASRPASPLDVKRISYVTHQVSYSGETLGLISSWYTGTPHNWKAIQLHNPRLNVHNIQIGQRIKIPSDLVIVQKSMPESMVIRASQGSSSPHGGSDLLMNVTYQEGGDYRYPGE